MNQSMRLISVLIAIGAVATQFVNCADSSEGNLFGGGRSNSLSSAGVYDATQVSFIQAKNEPPRMECTQDHIQVGGVCDVSGSEDNYIEYSISDANGVPVPWSAGSQNVSVLQEGRCENGRYFLIIPRPPTSLITKAGCTNRCRSVGCWEEYRLNSRVFVRRKGLKQFELMQAAPVVPIRMQLIINNACPKPIDPCT